jgi:hypothetical protein
LIDSVYLRRDFSTPDRKPGTYDLQVGIIDAVKGAPKIKLAIEGKDKEGWYTLGEIEIIN